MDYAVIFEDNPGTGMELRMKHMPAHLAFLKKNSSRISVAGPLKENDGSLAGGMWLVTADCRNDVMRLVEEDPFWPTGMRKSVNILEWHKVFQDGQTLVKL